MSFLGRCLLSAMEAMAKSREGHPERVRIHGTLSLFALMSSLHESRGST